MQELIDHLVEKVGLTPEQANSSIEAVKNFVKQKFPMLEGAVDNMFGSKANSSNAGNEKDDSEKAGEAFDNIKIW